MNKITLEKKLIYYFKLQTITSVVSSIGIFGFLLSGSLSIFVLILFSIAIFILSIMSFIVGIRIGWHK